MLIALAVCLAAVAAVVAHLVHQQRRMAAIILLPKKDPPKQELQDEIAKRAILLALNELREYEQGHIERQVQRLEHQRNKAAHHHKPRRPHGSYDPDQRREHVFVRVSHSYAAAGKYAPSNLEELIRREVPDEE